MIAAWKLYELGLVQKEEEPAHSSIGAKPRRLNRPVEDSQVHLQ